MTKDFCDKLFRWNWNWVQIRKIKFIIIAYCLEGVPSFFIKRNTSDLNGNNMEFNNWYCIGHDAKMPIDPLSNSLPPVCTSQSSGQRQSRDVGGTERQNLAAEVRRRQSFWKFGRLVDRDEGSDKSLAKSFRIGFVLSEKKNNFWWVRFPLQVLSKFDQVTIFKLPSFESDELKNSSSQAVVYLLEGGEFKRRVENFLNLRHIGSRIYVTIVWTRPIRVPRSAEDR